MTIDIQRLRQLLGGATKLPWQLATSNSWRRIVGFLSEPVCTPTNQPDGHPDLHFRNGGAEGSDAQLLIEAVNALPELLDQIDAQTAEIARWKDLFEMASKSVCAALARHGVQSVDDPGEAIDVLMAHKDAEISRLTKALRAAVLALAHATQEHGAVYKDAYELVDTALSGEQQ